MTLLQSRCEKLASGVTTLPWDRNAYIVVIVVVVNLFRASGMKVKQTVDKMATVADSLSEGGTVAH